MAQRLLLALAALYPSGGLGYDALHIVDLYQVICNSTGFVDIPLDVAQLSTEMFKPHVVTFLRSSNKQTTVSYSLVNAGGGEWTTGVQVVELEEMTMRRLAAEQGIIAGARVRVKPSVEKPYYDWGLVTLDSVGIVMALDDDEDWAVVDFPEQVGWTARISELQAEAPTHIGTALADELAEEDNDDDGEEQDGGGFLEGAVERRLASRRRSSPRRRAPATSPRRRAPATSPRRRAPASSPTPSRPPPPRRRAAALPRRRAATTRPTSSTPTVAPRRRAIVAPRRRNMPAEVGPRRRTTAYAPPVTGAPVRYNSAGTGGAGYGYTNQQSMYGNYGGQSPGVSSYGYSGHSSYGHQGSSGKSSAMMYGAGGFMAGAAVGVGGYYLYQRMKNAQCSGYQCCYGCSNSCYTGQRQNCNMNMNREYYRDDLMADSGFIPNDEKPWPLKIRIYSVSGAGYPSAPGAGVCPAPECTSANVQSDECSNATGDVALEPQDLFVTLTVLETLSDPQGDATAAAARNFGPGLPGMIALPVFLLALRALRGAAH